MTDIEFNFKINELPGENNLISTNEKYSAVASFDRGYGQVYLSSIVISAPLSESSTVPISARHSGTSAQITSQSIQIPWMSLQNELPPYKMVRPVINTGDNIKVKVINLHQPASTSTYDVTDSYFYFNQCVITIGNNVYTLTPNRRTDNRISGASFEKKVTSGGKRKIRTYRRKRNNRKSKRSIKYNS